MIKEFAVKTAINGVALWLTAWVVKGINFGTNPQWTEVLKTVVLVALVFGLVNTLIKPVAKLLSLPIVIVTLGLFTLVINAAMLQLTSWLSGKLGLAFHVDHFFWDAVLGAIIITFIAMILNFFSPVES